MSALEQCTARPWLDCSLYFPPPPSCCRSRALSDCTASGVAVESCIAALAKQCDADARCAAFSPRGVFWEHVDVVSCGQPVSAGAVFGGPPTEGMYLKSPLSVVPVPRKLYPSGAAATPAAVPPGGGSRPPAATSPAPTSSEWWSLRSMDVAGHDLGQATPPPGGSSVSPLPHFMAQCADNPSCAAFNLPGGWLKDSAHPADTVFDQSGSVTLFARAELPPQDYLTTTVVSLLDEMGIGGACKTGGAFDGRAHLYVMDTSRLSMHERDGPDGGPATLITEQRGPERDDYWFRAFAWLRARYGALPCVTFVPATSYTRVSEVSAPPLRGTPHFHPDNQRKTMPRGLVQQTLDFVGALRYAAAASPAAHALVWEDDCFACHGSLSALDSAVKAISTFDPAWGSVKIGNGGSGMLFHADIVGNLLVYLQTRRGSENIDVSMWRYLNSGAYSDYISRGTWSAHRGLTSSLRLGAGQIWGRVKCNGACVPPTGRWADMSLNQTTLQASLTTTGAGTRTAKPRAWKLGPVLAQDCGTLRRTGSAQSTVRRRAGPCRSTRSVRGAENPRGPGADAFFSPPIHSIISEESRPTCNYFVRPEQPFGVPMLACLRGSRLDC